MHTAPSTSLVRQIFDQAFNQGNLAIVDELISADLTSRMPGWGLPATRMGLKQMIVNLRSAFPDLHCKIDDEIGEGEKLAAHWTMLGTHQGSFFGSPPTGRPVTAQGLIFARTENGQIVEDWILIDYLGILQQLGLIPPPARR